MKALIFILFISVQLNAQRLVICNNEALKVELKVVGESVNPSFSVFPEMNIQSSGNYATVTITDAGNYTVIVDLETELGCQYQLIETFSVDTCPSWEIWIPNAISPNGTNRTWLPDGINIELLSIEIYDRWGHITWKYSGKPFDGYNNMNNEINGVFTYVVRFRELVKNTIQEKKGSVIVVR